MTTFLLDVNVLVALIDPVHVQHDAAHRWFAGGARNSWATCPLTENGVIRIVGHPRYPNSPGPPSAVVPLVTGLRALSGHVFWPDDITLLDTKKFVPTRLLNSNQVTDTYLLGLAKARRGQLATFDRRLLTNAAIGGGDALHVIDFNG